MSAEQTEQREQASRPPARGGRAWWQWVVGIGLLGAAAVSIVLRYVPGLAPVQLVPYTAEPREIRVLPALKTADRIPTAPGALRGSNLLLVTFDTTRADRIGCYGNPDIQTPTLDSLARSGVLFSQAIAPGPSTLPSHATILTGLYPYHHGARANGVFRLADEQQTLAETLSEAGYRTGAAVSAFVLTARYGLAQGFDHYDDDLSGSEPTIASRGPERPADRTTDRAIAWLRDLGDKPFFLWVHYFDPHADYEPPEPFAGRYADLPYDGEIAFADAELGRLLAVIAELGLTERTLTVVAGDHGEALGQHDEWTHGCLLYDATLHVPLIMSCGQRLGGGVHIEHPVGLIDVMPTVLSLLDVAGPGRRDGLDLTQPIPAPRTLFAETYESLLEFGWSPLLAVRAGTTKYIHGPQAELFNVASDPFEVRNLIANRPDDVTKLKQRLAEFYGDLEQALVLEPEVPPSQEELRLLEALGYSRPPIGRTAGPRPDPKSQLPLKHRVETAVRGIPTLGLDHAIEQLKLAHQEHPDFHLAAWFLADCYLRKGDLERAEQALETSLALLPDHASNLLFLADVKTRRGQIGAALALYDRMLRLYPENLEALTRRGWLLLQSGLPANAADLFGRAFEIAPGDELVASGLIQSMQMSNRGAEARKLLEDRLRTDPHLFAVRNCLAGLLNQLAEYGQAIKVLEVGLALDPERHQLANNLAAILATCPDSTLREPQRAAVLMEKVCDRTGYQEPAYVYTLAVIYAAAMRLEEAIALAERARGLAVEAGQTPLAQEIGGQIEAFKLAQQRGLNPMLNVIPNAEAAGAGPPAKLTSPQE